MGRLTMTNNLGGLAFTFACLVKDLWGIKCFATKEKAEAKLKELEGVKE